MKKRCIAIAIAAILLSVPAMVFAAPHDYAAETQTHQFRPHGGDRQEIGDFFAAVAANLANAKELAKLVAEDSSTKPGIDVYLAELAQYKEVKVVAASVEKLYIVAGYDAYTNYRAIAKFKFVGTAKDGKLIERTDYLGLAKLGKRNIDWRLAMPPNEWKLWGVIWKDSGIDVSNADLSQLDMPKKGEEICVMTTDAGVVKMRLFPDKAPKAVKNFKALAAEGFYNNRPFLRVYDNFMIQGGALDGVPEIERSSYGEFFEDEFSRDLFNFRGALCMGNFGPNTNGNQIYIVQNPLSDQSFLDLSSLPLNAEEKYKQVGGRAYLDWRYTVFGQVFEGIEVVDTIAKQKADDEGKPLNNPIKILKVEFVRY